MKKKTALFFCLLFVLILLASAAFLIVESDHDCEGEHCVVCMTMHYVRTMTKFAIAVVVVAILSFGASDRVLYSEKNVVKNDAVSPIELKVKLSI